MTCATMAQYPNRSDAVASRRGVHHATGVYANIVHCGHCDNYHLIVQPPSHREIAIPGFKSYEFAVLNHIAQGYTREESAKELGIDVRRVRWAMTHLMRRFNALNRAHLVAIAIALGMLDPCAFVPSLSERTPTCQDPKRTPTLPSTRSLVKSL